MMPSAPQPQLHSSNPTESLSIHVTSSLALRMTCVTVKAASMRGALNARVEIVLDGQSQKQPSLSQAQARPAPAPAVAPALRASTPPVSTGPRGEDASGPPASPRPSVQARLYETRFARALRLAALPVAALIATASTQPEHAAKAFEAAALAVDISAIAFAR
jgi:hypothetical protein